MHAHITGTHERVPAHALLNGEVPNPQGLVSAAGQGAGIQPAAAKESSYTGAPMKPFKPSCSHEKQPAGAGVPSGRISLSKMPSALKLHGADLAL